MSAVLDFTVGQLDQDERRLVLDSWMKSGTWRRGRIERAMADGRVLVARSEGVVLAWLCARAGSVCHGYTKQAFRRLGLQRSLWEAMGKPRGLEQPATRIAKRLMRRVEDWS